MSYREMPRERLAELLEAKDHRINALEERLSAKPTFVSRHRESMIAWSIACALPIAYGHAWAIISDPQKWCYGVVVVATVTVCAIFAINRAVG